MTTNHNIGVDNTDEIFNHGSGHGQSGDVREWFTLDEFCLGRFKAFLFGSEIDDFVEYREPAFKGSNLVLSHFSRFEHRPMRCNRNHFTCAFS